MTAIGQRDIDRSQRSRTAKPNDSPQMLRRSQGERVVEVVEESQSVQIE